MNRYDNETDIYEDEQEVYYDAESGEYLIYDDDDFVEQEPRWTGRRMIWFVIALVIILAMVGLLIAPLLETMIMPMHSYIPPPATPPSRL